jgi:hypothetical protein
MSDASLPLQLDPQGLKRLYRDYLKFVLLSATPEQRMQILSRERAALTRKDASPTDGTGRADRYTQLVRGSFDREDLTEALIEWAVKPPSLTLPTPNATQAQRVAEESAKAASTTARQHSAPDGSSANAKPTKSKRLIRFNKVRELTCISIEKWAEEHHFCRSIVFDWKAIARGPGYVQILLDSTVRSDEAVRSSDQ